MAEVYGSIYIFGRIAHIYLPIIQSKQETQSMGQEHHPHNYPVLPEITACH
jgi:hypothetical protein